MRNCLILGSGRSGTSLAAGMLARSEYFMGDNLYPPDDGNPKGYFEDREVNAINEGLLARLLPRRTFTDRLLGRPKPVHYWDGWLAEVEPEMPIVSTAKLNARIAAVTARAPFCFKDPRFCYTLPAWRSYCADALLVCVFRHPSVTAASLIKEAGRMQHLSNLSGRIDLGFGLHIWRLMYTHVLKIHYPAGGDWLFVHYDQLANGDGAALLESRLNTAVDRAFADEALRRSQPIGDVPVEILNLYSQLCQLAGYSGA
jgi:hypothetical protein